MPKPAIGAGLLVGFEDRVDGGAVEEAVLKGGAGHVVKGAHVAGVGGGVVAIVAVVNVGKLLDEGLHHSGAPSDDAAVEQGAGSVACLVVGVAADVGAQVGGVLAHPRIVERLGLVATKERLAIRQKQRLLKRIIQRHNICHVGHKECLDLMRMSAEKIPIGQIAVHIGTERRIIVDADEAQVLALACLAGGGGEVVVKQDAAHTQGSQRIGPFVDL